MDDEPEKCDSASIKLQTTEINRVKIIGRFFLICHDLMNR